MSQMLMKFSLQVGRSTNCETPNKSYKAGKHAFDWVIGLHGYYSNMASG